MPTHLTIAAIGPATAKALQRHQLNIHLLAKKNFTSETLAALPALKKVRHKKIIIFTGEAGRTWLAETLQKRKAQVTLAYAYQRLLPDDKMLRHWLQPAPGQTLEAARSELLRATHLIISYSNNSLENLAILFKKQQDCLIHKPILVISKRMQIFAQQLGFTQIITAKTATDSAVLRALKLWYSTHF
jgi:uroporphyrinogen-III synthase